MDILELLQTVELKDVHCVQLTAERRGDPEQGLSEIVPEDGEPAASMQVMPIRWDSLIEVWFRAVLETGNAKIIAAYAVQYTRKSPDPIPEPVRVEFVERVAIMAVVPYLREAIHGLGAKLRVPAPLLPILRQGEFQLSGQDTEAQAGAPATVE